MENQSGKKRTWNSELNKNHIPSQNYRVLSEFQEDYPMTLNAWTQTHPENFVIRSNQENMLTDSNLHKRIRKLEETIEMQSKKLNDIIKERTDPINSLSSVSTNNNIEYTIVADGNESQDQMIINSIEVQLSDQYQDDDINSSADSCRLQIVTDVNTEQDEDTSKNLTDVFFTVPTSSTPLSQIKNANINNVDTNKLSNGKAKKVMVSIGPNNTRIPADLYETMNWTSASIATRKLLMAIFDRETLATHTMTGKPSPAFKEQEKPVKRMLDPNIVSDIIFVVTRKTGATAREVRNSITTKCADENKIYKQKNKKKFLQEINKENIN